MRGTLPVGKTKLKSSIVLVGMMGSGKTAIGTALSKALGVAFLDSDEEIVKAANAPIAEIFEKFGEPFFREKESQVLERLLDGPPAVLSTGGGAFLAPANRALISAKGVSVCLQADVDLLWSRVKHKTTRPLLLTDNPRATLEEIYTQRAPVYALADLVVETRPEYSIAETTRCVIDALEQAGALERQGEND
ncbi:MAG: shikimate kinase [Brevirhabdus sp.]